VRHVSRWRFRRDRRIAFAANVTIGALSSRARSTRPRRCSRGPVRLFVALASRCGHDRYDDLGNYDETKAACCCLRVPHLGSGCREKRPCIVVAAKFIFFAVHQAIGRLAKYRLLVKSNGCLRKVPAARKNRYDGRWIKRGAVLASCLSEHRKFA